MAGSLGRSGAIARRAISALAVAVPVAATAVAMTGYGVSLSAPKQAGRGHTFTVTASGTASQRSIVNIWLDPRPCARTAQKEGARPGYGPGDSYFVDAAGGGAKVTYSSRPYTGGFVDAQTAHAGTRLGRQYICAYVNQLDAGPSNSRASATRSYRITR